MLSLFMILLAHAHKNVSYRYYHNVKYTQNMKIKATNIYTENKYFIIMRRSFNKILNLVRDYFV